MWRAVEHLLIIIGSTYIFNIKLSNEQCISNTNCKSRLRNGHDPYPERDNWKQPQWLSATDESNVYVDLIFLVDGSGSVTEDKFKSTMLWIKSVSRGFDISTGTFQIGVVQYSHWYRTRKPENQKLMRTEIELGWCQDHDCLETMLDNIEVMGFTTYTGFAINKTINEDFRNSKNLHKSIQILVLLTDGTSQDEVMYSSQYARLNNVTIFAVGIGSLYDVDELRIIATGDLQSSLRLYLLTEYDRLPSITDSLQSEIKSYYIRYVCPPLSLPIHASMKCSKLNEIGSKCTTACDYGDFTLFGDETRYCHVTRSGMKWSGGTASCGMCKEKFDLLIILDSSSSVTCAGFELAKQFVATLLDTLYIGPEDVQVSCLRYYTDVYKEFSYDDYLSKKELLKALLNIGYCGKGTRTGVALQYAVDNQFLQKSGRRSHVPHITLLITDGEARDNITGPSLSLKQRSKVYPIGVKNASPKDLKQISSDEHVMDILPEYKDLMNVTLVREMVSKFCQASREIKDILCDKTQLPVDEKGIIKCENDDDFPSVGVTCTLTCSEGYRTIGDGKAFCAHDGNWATTNWECIEKGCETLSDQKEIVVSCTQGDRIGSSCSTKCKPGYDAITPTNPEDEKLCEKGNNTIVSCFHTCERTKENGPKWDSKSIQCKKSGKCREGTCKFEGKCLKAGDDFFCSCAGGYTGLFCEVEINECEFVNCNNGVCIDRVNDYKCKCNPGFHGNHCQLNKNECLSRPCQHGGVCVDGINSYTCNCDKTGWTGKECEQPINECDPDPCMNKGFCRDKIGSYECECRPGFEGRHCETNIDDCASSPCTTKNTDDCIDKIAEFECVCKLGWEGSACHKDIDECENEPCGDRGRCRNSQGSYSCQCFIGYIGSRCETIIDYCDPDPCKNGGQCIKFIGSSKCECLAGYSGSRCNIDIDECETNGCKNGVCEDGVNEYSCNCYPGFSGKYCEIDIDECEANPCGKNGYCQEDKPGSYKCDCKIGYTGPNCEEDINDCISSPCQNDGTCVDEVAKFSCVCKPGFQGPFCSQYVNCGNSNNDCGKHGVCIKTVDGFHCKCDEGFDGNSCEINIDECEKHKCKNGAVCIDKENGYDCDCQSGFKGKYCEQNIDDCKVNPCQNGAACTDLINDYTCNCKPGYSGKRCQIQNDSCVPNPCKNDGICNPEEVGYRCECVVGFEGVNCQDDIDECEANPPICGFYGKCFNLPGSFECVCSKGYAGIYCQEICSLPQNVSELGEMSCTDGSNPGSECKIICPDGYRLRDSRSNPRIRYITELITKCVNGSWENASIYFSGSPPEWQCEIMTCAPLEKLSVHGNLKYQQIGSEMNHKNDVHKITCTNSTNVGSECTLECHEAFAIGGKISPIKKCNKDGTWSGSRWRCAQKKCFHPKLVNADTIICHDRMKRVLDEVSRFRPGTTCTLKCMKNFEVIGPENRTCNGNYVWEPDGFWECRERKCPTELPNISNGRYSCGDGARPGSVCIIICNSGFVQDERINQRIICKETDGEMVWNLFGNKGNCKRSECEFSIDLATPRSNGTASLTELRSPYKDNLEEKENRTILKQCNGKAIVAFNITKGDLVTIQLWYGRVIAGYHTVLTTYPDTNGHDAHSPSGEHLVTGVGRQLSSSGFHAGVRNNLRVDLDTLWVIVVPNSRATISLTFDKWTWKSKVGDWTGKIENKAKGNQPWYTVYLGMNRVPNTMEYFDQYSNGTGLCYVCWNRN